MDDLNRSLQDAAREADNTMDEIIRIALKIKLLKGLDDFTVLCQALSSPTAVIQGMPPRLVESSALWLQHAQRLQAVRDAYDWPAILDGRS